MNFFKLQNHSINGGNIFKYNIVLTKIKRKMGKFYSNIKKRGQKQTYIIKNHQQKTIIKTKLTKNFEIINIK